MSSHCPNSARPLAAVLAAVLLAGGAAGGAAGAAQATDDSAPLRVCSDPNNLPFSNRAQEGFENELARLVSEALGRNGVEYAWRPQRRGFVRNTLYAGLCDVIMGVPAGYERARTTIPYYRSSYVFVYRPDAGYAIESMDDPLLERLKIGIHAIGDDYSNTPGAAALARRGLVDNVVGFSIYGDYSEPHPPSRLVEAVAAGRVDVAIAWGPLAGYFASRSRPPLAVVPVMPQFDGDSVPFVFDISMATRRDDEVLHDALEQVIRRHAADIRAVLERYGVPLVPGEATNLKAEALP